jgi:hypothetical protein
VTKKRKAEMSKKVAMKKEKAVQSKATLAKMVLPKKINSLKEVRLKARPRPNGTSEIELALTKSIRVSKKFCLLDVSSSSHVPHDQG